MAEIQLLGMTHYPPFGWNDASMSGLMQMIMSDPDIPADAKDPANWSAEMQAEWANDKGAAAAPEHRAKLIDGLNTVRAQLDEFDPDVILIWGDDQYENFREDIVPPFSVLAYGDRTVQPYETKVGQRFPSYWEDDAADRDVLVKGRPDIARSLVAALLEDEFDVSYAYEPLHDKQLPHAFLNTILFLDHDRRGFDWPIIAMPINCYGSKVISAQGGWKPFATELDLDPPSPSPKRLMNMGASVARFLRDSPHRVSIIASSSWSHAFLTDHTWRLRPDTPADQALYAAMVAGDYDTWESTSTDAVVQGGQQEVLNWFALMGAARELGATMSYSTFVETHIFNSNKVFATWDVVDGSVES